MYKLTKEFTIAMEVTDCLSLTLEFSEEGDFEKAGIGRRRNCFTASS